VKGRKTVMDMNDIVDNEFDRVIKRRTTVQKRDIKNKIKNDLNRMILVFEKENKNSLIIRLV
jgi:hypothetical protein